MSLLTNVKLGRSDGGVRHGEDGWGLEVFSRDDESYTDKDGLTSVRTIGRYLYERQNPVTRKHEKYVMEKILEGWSLPKAKKEG